MNHIHPFNTNIELEPKIEYYAVMVEGANAPSKLHDSIESAEDEAIRLANKENKPTYVLMVISKFERGEIIKTEMVNLKK